jgi:hypothetical protein
MAAKPDRSPSSKRGAEASTIKGHNRVIDQKHGTNAAQDIIEGLVTMQMGLMTEEVV